MASLISAVLWVPRGVSARNPKKYDLSDPAELARVEKLGKIKLDDARRDLEELEKLEQSVDGMNVDEDDSGDWEDDASASDESGDEGASKAKKLSRTGESLGSQGEDDMRQYNLDNYDEEVSRSTGMSP